MGSQSNVNNNTFYLQNDVMPFKEHFYLHTFIPTICEAPQLQTAPDPNH